MSGAVVKRGRDVFLSVENRVTCGKIRAEGQQKTVLKRPVPRGAHGHQPPAFELYGLRRRFGGTRAVDGVDLSVPRGSFYGLVGPNGAGKTTSLTMAVGLLRPDGGGAGVFGTDVWGDSGRAKSMIGVLPNGMAMPERLTGRELLTYLGQLRGLSPDQVRERVDGLLTGLGLDEAENTLIIEYSVGMRKKIGLAGALVHAPGSREGVRMAGVMVRMKPAILRHGPGAAGSALRVTTGLPATSFVGVTAPAMALALLSRAHS